MNIQPRQQIDLNCDMGELHPMTGENHDEKIIPYISSCNVCCAFHSGSINLSRTTVELAIKHEVAVGAHPSYNDRDNFGRISPSYEISSLKYELNYQISLIYNMVAKHGQKMNHVKPHGALYNDLAKDASLCKLFVEVVRNIDPDLKIYGLANSIFEGVCLENGMTFINEVFADRRYQNEKMLRSRQHEGAVIKNEFDILNQIDNLINGKVIDYLGHSHSICSESICLHSDTEGAEKLAKTINHHLNSKGIAILPPARS